MTAEVSSAKLSDHVSEMRILLDRLSLIFIFILIPSIHEQIADSMASRIGFAILIATYRQFVKRAMRQSMGRRIDLRAEACGSYYAAQHQYCVAEWIKSLLD